jgi:vacuolar-type H+-ATPase subunit H
MNSKPDAVESTAVAKHAIERVLEAERDAQAAVVACEAAGSKALEAARQQARSIIERAQARAVALHGRAAKKVEASAAAVMEQRLKVAADAVRQLSDPARLGVALERLAVQLTTEAEPSDVA